MPLSSLKDYRDQLRKAWKKARRDLDEDSIHDLRVAARRVGASLLLVESVRGEDKTAKARRRVKRLMKKLGTLRDIQVQILIVKKWGRAENVRQFANSLERIERKEKARVRDYLSQHRKNSILQQLKDFERNAGRSLKKLPEATIQTSIQRALSLQRGDLETARKAMAPSDPRSLHAVRRTARKLRYCLEAAAETVGAAPQSELQRLRRIQTQLGNKRDRQLLQTKFEEWQKGTKS
jgi:CHAD domain-containing protein